MTTPRVPKSIAPGDRVSDVLARDESLVEVFVRHGSHFEKLRSPMMRRVMARLVTVEQAARTAAVPVDDLLRDLNRALGVPDAGEVSVTPQDQTGLDAQSATPRPAAHPAGRPTIELDVREDMRAGREPFSRIMAAIGALEGDRMLRLRTIFEPVPLFALLARRGFLYESRRVAPEEWSAWFWRAAPESDATAPESAAFDREAASPLDDESGEREHVLDVRGLEPPQPMLRTLAALDTLPDRHTLVQINARVPQLLFPVLVERGYACDVDESQAGRVIVRIWRRVRD